MTRLARTASGFVLALCAINLTHADHAFPSKPVRIVVNSAPDGFPLRCPPEISHMTAWSLMSPEGRLGDEEAIPAPLAQAASALSEAGMLCVRWSIKESARP